MSERRFGETPDDWAKREVKQIARDLRDKRCPVCWNRQPKKRKCGYCGGTGKV